MGGDLFLAVVFPRASLSTYSLVSCVGGRGIMPAFSSFPQGLKWG